MSVVAKSRARELTREDVIDAAAELVAERGYDGLSMRALAQRCGVATMTLYRHVRTKEDLLGALTDRVLSELELPTPGTLPWPEQIATVFRSVHDLLLEHPDLVEIAARQHVAGEAAYRGAEVVLDALRRARAAGGAPGQGVLARFPVGDCETLSGGGGVFLLRHSDRHFDDGLDLIIRGLASKAKTRAKGQR